jgi:murein DD-endopeptidase MepM/ murein hydrolase activator NlpD
MYESFLFAKDNYQRTVHVGIDIGGPVGTAVHAFEDGIIHSAGYNPELGDYGHVMVIEHILKNNHGLSKVYALYGHLSAKSTQGKWPGQKIKRGQTIGYMGNTAENGGWTGSWSILIFFTLPGGVWCSH